MDRNGSGEGGAGSRRVLLLGLDGADSHLLDPLWARGSCPATKHLASGARGSLRSVEPPLPYPAWSTLLTGNDPGRHGLFGFTGPEKGSYRGRLLCGGDRVGLSFLMRLSAGGGRVACLGAPATWPPEPVRGVMVSGLDAPCPDGRADGSAVHPPGALEGMEADEGPWEISSAVHSLLEEGRAEEALDRILGTLDRRAAHALRLYSREDWDLFAVVFGEIALAGRLFWRFQDPGAPSGAQDVPGRLEGALREVCERADRWVGAFQEMARQKGETVVIAVSSHGLGGRGDRVLSVNRFLERQGLLAMRRAGAWSLPGAFRRALRRLAGGRQTGTGPDRIDWSRTQAWSDEAPDSPSLRINLAGREPEGIVPAADYEAVRDRVAAALEAWRDPVDGSPVALRVLPREDVWKGAQIESAPDLVVEWGLPGGYSYLTLPSSGAGEPVRRAGGDGPQPPPHSGSPRPSGILLARGPGLGEGVVLEEGAAHLRDICPTVLHLAGLAVPSGLDGRVLSEALDFDFLRSRPPRESAPDDVAGPRISYTSEQEALVARRLREMGYL